MSKSRGVFVPPAYVHEFGPAAGVLLSQIAYWLTKAQGGQSACIVEGWGHRWLARSRDQLKLETGLSSGQLRSALNLLATKQIIAVEQHLYRNKNISHIRLGPNGADWVGSELPLDCAHAYQPEMAETANSIKGKTPLETEKEYGVSCTHPCPGKKKKEEGGECVTEANEPAHDSKALSAKQLDQVFRSAFAEAYGGEYLPPSSSKELGQFTHFQKKCPPGTAAAVIGYSVRNWHVVTGIAAANEGAFNIPGLPKIGFMLRMIQSMVKGYLDAQALPTKPPKPWKPIASEPDVKAEGPEPEQMATIEEVEAILFGDV